MKPVSDVHELFRRQRAIRRTQSLCWTRAGNATAVPLSRGMKSRRFN